MQAINLMTLANDASNSITRLTSMASLSNAPLRTEVRNGQIHLGVRSWSTYFFEKIVASDKELEHAKLKTHIAIEKHVRAFLNSPGAATEKDKKELVVNLLHARATEKLAIGPVLLKPKKEPDTQTESGTKKKTVLHKVFDKPFNEAILVTEGVSIAQPSALEEARPELKEKSEWVMGIVSVLFNPLNDKNLNLWIRKLVTSAIKPPIKNSTLHVIADVRLVRKETKRAATGDLIDRGTILELPYSNDFKNFRTKDAFKAYYQKQLKDIAGSVKSTLLLELPYDSEPVCTDNNVSGALEAVNGFIETQKRSGKTVSVMIVVPRLPVGELTSSEAVSPDGESKRAKLPGSRAPIPRSTRKSAEDVQLANDE